MDAVGSQPTYKGLKLMLVNAFYEDVRSSQPTYKGLKRASGGQAIQTPSCSQPTYKGLKLYDTTTENLNVSMFAAYL